MAAGAGLGALALTRAVPVGTLVDHYLKEETGRAMLIYRQAALAPDQLKELQTITDNLADFLGRAWPGLAIAGTGILLLLTVLLLAAAARERYTVPGPSLSIVESPRPSGLASYCRRCLSASWCRDDRQAGLSLLLVILPIYFLQGMAIVHHYFRKGTSRPFFAAWAICLSLYSIPCPWSLPGWGSSTYGSISASRGSRNK